MSLLTPLFLIGLLGIGLPLWLHRLQTQTNERERFSSGMLLVASEQRVHMQRKLRYLLLLAFRILLLTFLALAFAKPVWDREQEPVTSSDQVIHMIVMDTSLSMSAEGVFEEAVDEAESIINGLSSDDLAQIVAADKRLKLVTPLTANKNDLHSALNTLAPDNGRLDYGEMMTALNAVLADYNNPAKLHFVSDMQASGLSPRFADMVPEAALSHHVELALYKVGQDNPANRAIEYIRMQQDSLQVGIRDHQGEESPGSVSLWVNDELREQTQVRFSASDIAQVEFTGIEFEKGENRLQVTLAPEDILDGDNIRYFVVSNTPPAPVLLLTARPAAPAAIYLKTALNTGGYELDAVDVSRFDPRVLSRYSWIIIDDLGGINETLEGVIRDYLQEGNAVLATLSEQSATRTNLPVTRHTLGGPTLSVTGEFISVSRIDSSHPVLANISGWRSINIGRSLTLEPHQDDRVLITLQDGRPFLLEKTFDQGRMMLLTSNLDNSWSDLPVHPVFVSFVSEVARYLGNENLFERQYQTGDTLLLRRSGVAAGQVIDPDGRTILSLQNTMHGQDVALSKTGFYQVITPAQESLIAVNPDTRESDTTIMVNEMMQRWQGAFNVTADQQPETRAGFTAQAGPVRWELWRVLLVVLALVVLLESLLGNHHLTHIRGSI